MRRVEKASFAILDSGYFVPNWIIDKYTSGQSRTLIKALTAVSRAALVGTDARLVELVKVALEAMPLKGDERDDLDSAVEAVLEALP